MAANFSVENFTVLADELVPAAGSSPDHPDGRFLTDWDRCMATVGQFGGGVLFERTLDTPLLKAALAQALASMPFLVGRLGFLEDGRLDIRCTNAGARFVAASTSSTLQQLRQALAAAPYARALANPWSAYWPPRGIDAVVQQQWPLVAGFVLHLSGGGTALWLAAHHCVADFESLQTLAAHWSAAYNAALQARQASAALAPSAVPAPAPAAVPAPEGSGPAAAAGSGASGAEVVSYAAFLPEGRRAPAMGAAEVEALATQGPPPPPGLPPRREMAEATALSGLTLLWWAPAGSLGLPQPQRYVMLHMVWRGGGVEARTAHVSAQRLAQLKAQASAELAQAPGGGCGVDGGSGPGDASGSRAERSSSAVEWVSTNDALVGRLLQVLHALPLRRATPVSCFVSADMRRRLAPPLPASRVGNLVYSVRLEGLRPGGMRLAELAAAVRHSLTHHVVPQFRGCLARARGVIARVAPRGVLFSFCLEPAKEENIFAPEGPINLTRWDVDFGLWQFGGAAPLAFLPLAELGPCIVTLYPAAPGKGGLEVLLSMHRAAWRQLDAMCGDFSAAI
ncbi:hypothetical protein TSOC_001365 [Tetrabaena socialis]|uniref:Uncharacterized protein n=1 Tax=Tetrabaena socialis TaxID=47790 RepID=A0A2J8AGZ7_9CHLO|nr:hypothetical protein TSOC_001365 [Tetrabaena socialis]|eukprot:PNH11766.1 hypothetical protein TSOC_001365 [Tetrabaena socialis]